MAQPEKVRTRIQSLDERLARLRVEKNRLIARANQTERKRDTRRKILIGGAVLAAIEHEGVPTMRTRAELLRWLDARLTRPNDRSVFELPSQEETADKTLPFGLMSRSARSEATVKDAEQREAPRSGAQRP